MDHKQVRVLVVEDDNLLRSLLESSLETLPQLTVAGSYAQGSQALKQFTQDDPDVALLDINLGSGWNGIETGLELRKAKRQLGIVLLSNYARPELLSHLPQNSLPGWSYLLKQSVRDLQTLVRAIEGAASNLVVLDPSLVAMAKDRDGTVTQLLTPRQIEILSLVAEGYTNTAIAKTLYLSEKSIENHMTAIYSALGINSSSKDGHARVKAVLAFMRNESLFSGPR